MNLCLDARPQIRLRPAVPESLNLRRQAGGVPQPSLTRRAARHVFLIQRGAAVGLAVDDSHQVHSHAVAIVGVHDDSPESMVSIRCRAAYSRLMTVPRGMPSAVANSS